MAFFVFTVRLGTLPKFAIGTGHSALHSRQPPQRLIMYRLAQCGPRYATLLARELLLCNLDDQLP